MEKALELRIHLRCPHCQELGLAAYASHPSPRLSALYGKFHCERDRAPGPLIVCDECDEIQEAA